MTRADTALYITVLIVGGLALGVVLSFIALGVVMAFCTFVVWVAGHPAALLIWLGLALVIALVVAACIRVGQGPPTA